MGMAAVFWQTLRVAATDLDPSDESAPAVQPPAATPVPAAGEPSVSEPPRELGGRPGPDPTRYGDWELRGRCIDF